jgi:outer membrane receptor protein involved in Fe transport
MITSRLFHYPLAVSAAALLVSLAATSVYSDAGDSEQLEEVIVTATKRGLVNVQDVAISLRAITGAELKDRGATVFDQWSRSVPGLVFQDQGPGDKRYIIRGVQSIGAATVGVYLDDAVITGSNAEDDGGGKNVDIRLFDIERIEVLRGPQGTLYGTSSMSGTIRILSNKPDLGELYGNTGLEISDTRFGDVNYTVNGTINVPVITDKVAIRATGWRVDDSGYINNIRLGNEDINTEETSGGRLSLAIKPTDRLTLNGQVLVQDQDIGGKSFFFPADGELNQSEYTAGGRKDQASIYQGSLNYDFGSMAFDFSSAYLDRDVDFQFDSTPILIFFGVPDLPAVTLQPEKSSIWTNEARLSSAFSGPLQFIAGALYQQQERDFESSVISVDANGIPTRSTPDIFGRISSRDVDQYALFGEASFDITPQLTALAGVRWFKSKEHAISQEVFPFFGGPPEPTRDVRSTETKVTPKFSLSYKVTDDAMIYALAAQGFRQGGTNSGGFGSVIVVPFEFEADSLWNYEIGAKTSWLDRRVVLNVSAYTIRWSNMQTKNRNPQGFVFIGNAGTATTDGFEVELNTLPSRGLEISGSVAYQKARLTEDQPLAEIDTDVGLDGDRIPNVPKWTASASAQYSFPVSGDIEGLTRADYSYVGSSNTYFNSRSEFFQNLDAYSLLNLKAGFRTERWEATLFVNNLFDKRAEVDKLFQIDAPLSVFTTRPRTIGVNLGVSF